MTYGTPDKMGKGSDQVVLMVNSLCALWIALAGSTAARIDVSWRLRSWTRGHNDDKKSQNGIPWMDRNKSGERRAAMF